MLRDGNKRKGYRYMYMLRDGETFLIRREEEGQSDSKIGFNKD